MRNKRKGYQTKNLPKKEGVQAAVNDRNCAAGCSR